MFNEGCECDMLLGFWEEYEGLDQGLSQASDFQPFGAGIFFKILAHPVYKMWILQEPKKIALWNKGQLEEKKLRMSSMFKIFSKYICWVNV